MVCAPLNASRGRLLRPSASPSLGLDKHASEVADPLEYQSEVCSSSCAYRRLSVFTVACGLPPNSAA